MRRGSGKKSPPARRKQTGISKTRKQTGLATRKQTGLAKTQKQDHLDQFGSIFRKATRYVDGTIEMKGTKQNRTAHFRGPSASKKKKIRSALKKHNLANIVYGNPFFSIDRIHFSIGTVSGPGFDVESIPHNINGGEGFIYFGFDKNLRDKTSTKQAVRDYLGLDSKEKSARGQRVQIIELGQQRTSEKVLVERLLKTKAYQQMKGRKQEQKRMVESAKAKAKYPYSFPISDLPLFIDQIQDKFPHVAIALAKVYLGPTPGSASNCPEAARVNEIGRLPKNKKPTKSQVQFIHSLIGPLATYVSKKTRETPKGKRLRWYQQVGVAFWRATGGRAMIADEPGVGKTIQAIACAKLATIRKSGLPSPWPILVICPKSIMPNWAKNFPEWMNCNPIEVSGSDFNSLKSRMPKQNAIVITTYASATRYQDILAKVGFKMVIMDECHEIKNPNSQRSLGLRRLAYHIPLVVLTSGTPMKNSVFDLWAQMYILDPQKFKDPSTFEAQFDILKYDPKSQTLAGRLPHSTKLIGNKFLFQRYNIQNSEQYVMEPPKGDAGVLDCYMIRRLKSQVLDLPPKDREYHVARYDAATKKTYEKWEEEAAQEILADRMHRWADDVALKTKKNIEQKGMKPQVALRMAKESSKELLEKATSKGAGTLAVFSKLRRKGAMLTLPKVVQFIKDFYSGQPGSTQLLVFAVHHKIIDKLVSDLSKVKDRDGKHLVVKSFTGKTSARDRLKLEKDFNQGKINVMVLNKAGNEGLNLQTASTVVFAERFWTPADEEQAEDRAHRSGQKNPVTVHYFTTEPWGTGKIDESTKKQIVIKPIDTRINDIVLDKRAKVQSTIGSQKYASKESVKSQVQKQWLKSLSQRYASKLQTASNKNKALKLALERYGLKNIKVGKQ